MGFYLKPGRIPFELSKDSGYIRPLITCMEEKRRELAEG
jgi:hypothetical protein